MDWLANDLQLLEGDAAQLRQHLGWLLEDLEARRDDLNGLAPALAACFADAEGCLDRLVHLDSLLTELRSALAS